MIPDDPTTLSYLLAGIIQIELPRRQALLEAETTDERLRELLELIDRETLLLRRRLRAFIPTPRHSAGAGADAGLAAFDGAPMDGIDYQCDID